MTAKPERIEAKDKLKFYIQDDENTMLYNPADMHNNKFFGTWSKVLTLERILNQEEASKYHYDYQAYMKARVEVGAQPGCFNRCIGDVSSSGLSSDEKNCMRECFLKKVSSRDDIMMLFTQKAARDTLKGKRDEMV